MKIKTMKIKTINSHCVVIYKETYNKSIKAIVYSYDTPVIYHDENGKIFRVWDGWSITTQRDINKAIPLVNMTKAKWDKMPVVDCNF